MLSRKSFEKVFDTQKKIVFQDTFWKKNSKTNLENYLRAKPFAKCFLNFVSEKNVFCENVCSKKFSKHFDKLFMGGKVLEI